MIPEHCEHDSIARRVYGDLPSAASARSLSEESDLKKRGPLARSGAPINSAATPEGSYEESRSLVSSMLTTSSSKSSVGLSLLSGHGKRHSRGYDVIFLDEAHLANENERSLIRCLLRDASALPQIVMALDLLQSVGDTGLREDSKGRLVTPTSVDNGIRSELCRPVLRICADNARVLCRASVQRSYPDRRERRPLSGQ